MNLFKETILSAIIMELAQFMNVSASDFLCQYADLLKRYANIDKIHTIIEDACPADCWNVIQRAKALASGDSDPVEKSSDRSPLCSIFSAISLDGSYPEKMYYSPAVLSMDHVVPVPILEARRFDYEAIRNGLCREMDLLVRKSPADFDSFLIVMDALTKKYLWCISSTGNVDEDVSLYNYIQAMIAIIAALLKADDLGMPYVMVAGHFSGIQNYVFSVSQVGTSGVAKRLRAHSFYVNALVSSLAHCIIHKFELPMANILMSTGGKFYILLPLTKDTEKILDETERSMSEFLYRKFRGRLSFELAWSRINDEGIQNYSDTVAKMSQRIEQKKDQLLKSVLIKGDQWDTSKFIVYDDLHNKSMCPACRSALVDNEGKMCSNCTADTEIGGKLPKIRQFSFSRNQGQYELLEGYYLNLDIDAGLHDNYLIMNMNDTCLDGLYDKPISIYYAVNNVPLKETRGSSDDSIEVKTFSEIAEESRGCKKIGVLKADVDTLGFLFSEGLKRENRNTGTISRVNTLSWMLELFFNGYLNDIIKKKYQSIYCVFAGGDDLFFIGPWSDMPILASEINQKFHEYTGHNKCMTLSAAICMDNGNGHISTLAEICEDHLEAVKKHSNRVTCPGKSGRNGVYFLDEIMSWEDFERHIEIGDKFADSLPETGTAILHRLGNYSHMYQEYLDDGDVNKLMFLPMFSYDRTRNYRDLQRKESWFIDYCDECYKAASDYRRNTSVEFYYTEFSARYAFYLTKEERKNG